MPSHYQPKRADPVARSFQPQLRPTLIRESLATNAARLPRPLKVLRTAPVLPPGPELPVQGFVGHQAVVFGVIQRVVRGQGAAASLAGQAVSSYQDRVSAAGQREIAHQGVTRKGILHRLLGEGVHGEQAEIVRGPRPEFQGLDKLQVRLFGPQRKAMLRHCGEPIGEVGAGVRNLLAQFLALVLRRLAPAHAAGHGLGQDVASRGGRANARYFERTAFTLGPF